MNPMLRRLLAHRGALLGIAYIVLLAAAAIFAHLILPSDPLAQDLANTLDPPSAAHWFGTDELGRDLMTRAIYGARTSLITALGAVIIAGLIGVPIGLVAGFFGGWRDAVLMRLVDVLLALPGILFAMALIAVLPGIVLTLTILSLDTLGRTLSRLIEDRQSAEDGP